MSLSLGTALLITGILGFMLTPDGWPWSGSFWDAFFNPTFLPMLMTKLSGACALGSIFALTYVSLSKQEPVFREEVLGKIGRIFLTTLLLVSASAFWYFYTVPPAFKTHAVFSVITSAYSGNSESFWIANTAGFILLGIIAWLACMGSNKLRYLVIPAIIVSVLFVAQFERIREFGRGPYIIPGYMYTNQVLMQEKAFFDQQGLLNQSYWYNATTTNADLVAQGQYLFGQNCSVCHTIGGGVNDISKRVKGRPQDGIYAIIGHTQEMVPYMSPFSGNERERKILAEYLYKVAIGQVKVPSQSRFLSLGEDDQ